VTDALEQIRTRGRATPQAEQAEPDQVRNDAGGWSFTAPGETRIRRFLTIGTTGGTYYATERELTAENAEIVLDWAKNRPQDLVRIAAEISAAGRAPRNQPAILAIMAAMALGDIEGRRAAERAFTDVIRTGTHLFTAAKYREQFGGWGRIARRTFASWYLGKDPEALAYQLVKYRQRDGWTHRDVLRSAHSTKGCDAEHARLFGWLCGRDTDITAVPQWITAYETACDIARSAPAPRLKADRYAQLIRDYPGLPWEALPDEALTLPDVWRALIDAGLPQTALLRQLPRLTRLGVIAPMSSHLAAACAQLTDPERLRKGRVHPLQVLIAAKTYAAGRSGRGSGTWVPVPQVSDALDGAFYAAFGAVEPSGKRTMVNLDISGSMTSSAAGYNLSAREVVAGMALVTLATEPATGVYGFSHRFMPLRLSPGMRLDQAAGYMKRLPYGGTDCALPMLHAAQTRTEVDTFQIWSDYETWAGSIHPHQALEAYRQATGIPAKLQMVAVAPNAYTLYRSHDPAVIADDPLSLDVSGFDAAVPRLLADHARGDL